MAIAISSAVGGYFAAASGEISAAIAPLSIALCQKSPPSTRVPGIPINISPCLQAWELVQSPLTSISSALPSEIFTRPGTLANKSRSFMRFHS